MIERGLAVLKDQLCGWGLHEPYYVNACSKASLGLATWLYDSSMKNKPPYPLSSVDNALLLLHLLRDQGQLGVTEAAETLGVVRSTAHRLLSMLVYRDFAIRDESHRYRPGPSLFVSAVENRPTSELTRIVLPYMNALRDRSDESVQLSIRSGRWTRFIATVECTQYLRVGDRRGTALPARASSGGRALLAELTDQQLSALYIVGAGQGAARDGDARVTQREWNALIHSLTLVRIRGFAVSLPDTEPGVRAVSVALHNEVGSAVGALSVAGPTRRMNSGTIEKLAADLLAIAQDSIGDLTGYREESPPWHGHVTKWLP